MEGLVKSSRRTPTKFDNGFEPSFDSDGTPSCLSWSIEDVADWVEFLGFKQYRVRRKSLYVAYQMSSRMTHVFKEVYAGFWSLSFKFKRL